MQEEFNDLFHQLLEQNKQQILRICAAYCKDADEKKDLFQEVVINIWKSLPSFEGRAAASTWIYRITLNTCMRARMKSDKYQANHLKLHSIHFETIRYDDSMDQHATQVQINNLYRCIGQLKDMEKNIVLLYLEDLPYKEIATVTGVTENHVAVYMKRIKEKLLTCLKN